jgi:hypothetical protein
MYPAAAAFNIILATSLFLPADKNTNFFESPV